MSGFDNQYLQGDNRRGLNFLILWLVEIEKSYDFSQFKDFKIVACYFVLQI